MKLFLICLILLISKSICAQKDELRLSVSPLAALDFINGPMIQAGIEYRPSRTFGWHTEAGFQNMKAGYEPRDSSVVHPHGVRIKTELRYYIQSESASRRSIPPGAYVAVNVFYIGNEHNQKAYYRLPTDSTMISRADLFGVRKRVWGLNALIGRERSWGHWGIDWYIGLGIRFRYITPFDKEFIYGKDLMISPIDWTISSDQARLDARGGYSVVPNLTAGLRLTYRL